MRVAAIDKQPPSRRVTGAVRQQEGQRVRDLFRRRQSLPQRDAAGDVGELRFGVGAGPAIS